LKYSQSALLVFGLAIEVLTDRKSVATSTPKEIEVFPVRAFSFWTGNRSASFMN